MGFNTSGSGWWTPKKIVTFCVIGAILLLSLIFASSMFETVKKGTYQIKQAAITGAMSAKMTPGLWMQAFGDIQTWPKAETFYFTADVEEGEELDQSIEVRFVDGSICHISGTCRVQMPIIEEAVLDLVIKEGYKSFLDLELKLILPVVRNSLRLTANLMNARESYAEKRTDFNYHAWEQIQNGLYETIEEIRKEPDPISGELVTRTYKIIKKKKDGTPVHQINPMEGLGIALANFEIKKFVYDKTVVDQIATQQEALMAVATAKTKAQEAEQNALTVEAQGKASVMTAKYEKEEERVREVVAAQKRLDVAVLEKRAAAETKQKEILLGQGEAERKRLVLAADGALRQKLDAMIEIQKLYADAWKVRPVPAWVWGSGSPSGGSDESFIGLIQVLTAKITKDLGLDMTIPRGKTVTKK